MAFKAKKSKAVESSTPASWSVAQFSSFYTQNRSELIAHANRIVKDKAKAEEITQESLVKFMLAAPELESNDHALSYLHRTIENLCIDLFRAENRRPNLIALDDASAEVESTWQVSGDHSLAISAAEDAAIIRQALSLLSPAERAALVMWEVEGRSTKEIAKELGIKESAVRHTVSRARTSLRKVLSELVIDEARGLTALDLLSTTYKKAAELAGKSSKIALTFILVLTAFLGLNSLTGNESNTTITTSSSQLSNDQDLPEVITPSVPEQLTVAPTKAPTEKTITVQEYSDHMSLSTAQLETVVLMLQVLEQSDGGPAPTE
jgi:RNA polymerase sigma factor (sigma-70 family)